MSGNLVIEEMSRRRLKDSLEAHRLLLVSAKNKAREAQVALIELGMEFCGEQFDALQKSGEDLQLLLPGDLARIIRDHLGLLKMAAGSGDDRDASVRRLAQANREVAELQKELNEQRKRAAAAERQVRDLQSQAGSLQNTIERLQSELHQKESQLPVHGPDAGEGEETSREAGFTSWLQTYNSDRNFEREVGIIRILGDTGVSRYPELEDLVTSGMQISNSTVYWAVKECETQELIERQSEASALRGRPQHLVILTGKGRWLYQKLTGENPKESEHTHLLRAHKSSGHLALILRVADLLAGLGYEVVREPLRIQIEENRYFQPDLVIRKVVRLITLRWNVATRTKRACYRSGKTRALPGRGASAWWRISQVPSTGLGATSGSGPRWTRKR
jgi:hypothetical protein